MSKPSIDINVSITPDAKKITISDNTPDWGTGGIYKDDITSLTIIVFDTDGITELINSNQDIVNTASLEVIVSDLNTEDELPDGVYPYSLSYAYDTGSETGTLTLNDVSFVNTAEVERNIDHDLLDVLVGLQAYNFRMDYSRLEEIRRRDNILFAVNSADFISEAENAKALLHFLKRLE